MIELIYGFIFILIAIILSIKENLKLERELLVSAILAFIQLIFLGYVLIYVFEYGGMAFTYLIICIMILTATYIVNNKIKVIHKRKMFIYLFLTFLIITIITLSILVFSKIIPYEPKYVIPLMGMAIGNSMNTVHLALDKIIDHIKSNRDELWGYLSLGAGEFQALKPFMTIAIKSSIMPTINRAKSVGIIFIPGAMTGMILSGVDPLYAAKIQIIIMWMILGNALLSELILFYISYKELIKI